VWAPIGERPIALGHHRFEWLYVTGFVEPATGSTWFGMLTKALWTAHQHDQGVWRGLFLFIICYVLAAVIKATFDVALEGPMQGVWLSRNIRFANRQL
jgi:hypothetical protein